MKKDRRELILYGNIYKAIAIISIPIILNNFIQQLYSTTLLTSRCFLVG